MAYLGVVLFISLVVIDRLHRLNVKTTIRKHQFELFKVRDSLRREAIEGRVDPKNWVFQYLDSSLTKAIDGMAIITVWSIGVELLRFKDDADYRRSRKRLKREMAKPGNHVLAEFHSIFTKTISQFLMARHPGVRFALFRLLAAAGFASSIRQKWNYAAEYQTESSRLSTLPQFCG